MSDHDANDFSLGQGDDDVTWTLPPLFDADGAPIDPTGGSVKLHYRLSDASIPAVEVVGTVHAGVGGNAGLIGYTFRSSDSATAGVYRAVWILTLASSEVVTYPAIIGRGSMQFEVIANP